jgi:hypothetical protein
MRAVNFIVREFEEALPPILFFLVAFNLVELTTQLILAEYLARLANFMIATTTALVVGKAVLVANALPFLSRFDRAPMIRPVLFKTVIYWAVVFVARLLEQVVEFWIGGGALRDTLHHLSTEFSWHRFAAIQIWIFVSFLVYTFVSELDVRLGEGELANLLFKRRPTEVGLAQGGSAR